MSETTFAYTPTAATLTFQCGQSEAYLTITPDGRMIIGGGLSEDEATQRVAKLLAENYSQLHKDQADEIARLKASGAST